MYDSYGKKCNHRFFLNYGFINLNNDANEFPFKVYFNPDDKFLQIKKDLLLESCDYKKFRITGNFEDKCVFELLSWIRFVEFDENMALIYEHQGAAISAA